LFRQYGFLHCGAPVISGTKYTVRTDIMYRKHVENDSSLDVSKLDCGLCQSKLFWKECTAGNEKVPSCNCSHIYGNAVDTFPCLICDEDTSFKDIANEDQSKSF